MVANKSRLISFNSFLSPSKNRDGCLMFVDLALANTEMVSVLFVMNIDPVRSSTSFASVIDVEYFEKQEDEVLFSIYSVFHIGISHPWVVMLVSSRCMWIWTVTRTRICANWSITLVRRLLRMQKDGIDWAQYYGGWMNLPRPNKCTKYYWDKRRMRVTKHRLTVPLEWWNMNRGNMQGPLYTIRNRPKSKKNKFFAEIRIWLDPTATSVLCTKI